MYNPVSNYYVYTKPLSAQEQLLVNKGYLYVLTTSLGPCKPLTPHGHNKINTHKVLRGYLKIDKHVNCCTWLRGATYKAGEEAIMAGKVCYRGKAGLNGAAFVEGHKLLSPTTARRFQTRKQIKPASKDTPGAFPVTWNGPHDCQGAIDADSVQTAAAEKKAAKLADTRL